MVMTEDLLDRTIGGWRGARPDIDTASLQVTDAKETSLEVKVFASARSSGALNDLRNDIREKMIAFLQQEYPACLPRLTAPVVGVLRSAESDVPPRRQAS